VTLHFIRRDRFVASFSVLERDAHINANKTLYISFIAYNLSRRAYIVPLCLRERSSTRSTFCDKKNVYIVALAFSFSTIKYSQNAKKNYIGLYQARELILYFALHYTKTPNYHKKVRSVRQAWNLTTACLGLATWIKNGTSIASIDLRSSPHNNKKCQLRGES
jgi:hypothetical protein